METKISAALWAHVAQEGLYVDLPNVRKVKPIWIYWSKK